MTAIPRILVAIKNPWARSLPVVDKAMQLARALDAEVRLFHGLSDPVVMDVREIHNLAKLERTRRERMLARLTAVAKRLGRGIDVTVAAEWDFPAYEAVIRAAQQFKAGLIIAEPHPGVHRMPWLLRFNDFELLRLSPSPVLLIKTRHLYAHPVVLAAVDPAQAHAKPAALDAQILRYGSTLARALRGALHAVHAFNPFPASFVVPEFDTMGALGLEAAAQSQAQARAALDRTLRSAVARSRRHLVGRYPVDAIDEVAREVGAGIVVMGAVSRTGAKRLLIGSTSQKLLERLPCDVLIVKPADFPNRVPMIQRGAQMIVQSSVQPGY